MYLNGISVCANDLIEWNFPFLLAMRETMVHVAKGSLQSIWFSVKNPCSFYWLTARRLFSQIAVAIPTTKWIKINDFENTKMMVTLVNGQRFIEFVA